MQGFQAYSQRQVARRHEMKGKNLGRLAVGLFLAASLLSVVATQGSAQGSGRFFGLGEYPGGTLKTVFEIQRGGPDAAIRSYTVEIVPDGDQFNMIETIISPRLVGDNIDSGLGRSGAAGAAGASYNADEQQPNIDLTPLYTLDERNVAIQPNENYYLPDGARLVTGESEVIAGISVVMGTFLHPKYPSQRVLIAFASPEIERLLLFPVYMVREVDGEMEYRTELVEFSHEL